MKSVYHQDDCQTHEATHRLSEICESRRANAKAIDIFEAMIQSALLPTDLLRDTYTQENAAKNAFKIPKLKAL